MKILLLSNQDCNLDDIIQFLVSNGEEVIVKYDKQELNEILKIMPDFIVSYNYKFIISKPIIEHFKDKIINLHISYLPWNRGAHPNFWSFWDDTPKGVTIHYMDEGLDTGDIIIQRELTFDDSETLKSTYDMLQSEIKKLFKENWMDIRKGKCNRIPQTERGSFHYAKEFNEVGKKWTGGGVEYQHKKTQTNPCRIRLRKVTEDDLEMIMNWRMLPNVTKYMFTDPSLTIEDQRAWFKKIQFDDRYIYWIIEVNEQSIGLFTIMEIDQINNKCSFGWYIAEDHFRGMGIGQTIELNVLDYIFFTLELNRLEVKAFTFNSGVINLHKKCGFDTEGVMKEYIRKKDQYYDVAVMGITASKWNVIRKDYIYDKIEIESL